MSNHDFFKTPSKEEIISRLCAMQEKGADIPKIAVMPQSKKDVLTLLSATNEMVPPSFVNLTALLIMLSNTSLILSSSAIT